LNCEHDDQRQRIIEKQLSNIRAVWRLAGALLTMGHRYGSGTSRCILNTPACTWCGGLTARLASETTGR
jgi:hypothetical protein